MRKRFVKVLVEFSETGFKRPVKIFWNNENVFEVDKVLSVKNRPSYTAGGMGERYEIQVNGSRTFLFYEDGLWFVEEKMKQ